MWSRSEPMPRPPSLTPTPAAQQIQTILHECDGWLRRLGEKYHLPRAILVKHLDQPLALEYEIAELITEWTERTAHDLFAAGELPPKDDDLFSRAVRGVHGRLVRQKEAADEAERLQRFKETDELIRRMRAGEDGDL